MKEIKLNLVKTLIVPAGADRLTVQHEWNDIVVLNQHVSISVDFIPDSVGVYTFIFSSGDVTIVYPVGEDNVPLIYGATITGDFISTTNYDCILNYLDSSSFFNDYPALDVGDNLDTFAAKERRIRRLVENFTKQEFGPFLSKTKVLQGEGGNSLALPLRILQLISCKDSFGNDMTSFVEITPDLNEFVQRRPRAFIDYRIRPVGMLYDMDIKSDITRDTREFFTDSLNFIIKGDWGWRYVPIDISEAVSLLMVDEYTGVNDARKHRQTMLKLDDFEVEYDRHDLDSSTGNVDADNLLLPYTTVGIGLV